MAIEEFPMDFENRIITPEEIIEDNLSENENALRPKTMNDYIGQEKAKENL